MRMQENKYELKAVGCCNDFGCQDHRKTMKVKALLMEFTGGHEDKLQHCLRCSDSNTAHKVATADTTTTGFYCNVMQVFALILPELQKLQLRLPRRYITCDSSISLSTLFFVVVICMSGISVPYCTAMMYQFPLRKVQKVTHMRNAAKLTHATFIRNAEHAHIFRRDASLSEMKSMKRNLNGVSEDGYYIDVEIGTPPQQIQVLIDTGSANFAVACEPDLNLSTFFNRANSTSYTEDGSEIYVPYTEGEWNGVLGTDVVKISSNQNVLARTNIACITKSKDFFLPTCPWQGILGLAYAEISQPDSSLLPFWDSVLGQGAEVENVFSVLLCGSSFVHTHKKPLMEGTLIFGGVLPSLSKSEILYTPLYKEWYYEVVLTGIEVNKKSISIDCKELNFDKTIVDTGTTTIRLPQKVFSAVVSAIDAHIQLQDVLGISTPGDLFYSGDDILCYADMLPAFQSFPVISFFLYQSDNSSFRLDITPQHYLRPVASEENVAVPDTCVKFGFSPSTSGTVLGAVFMEAFYVVFDRANSRIGFGQSTCPLPDPKYPIQEVIIEGPLPSQKNLSECAFKKPDTGEQKFAALSYAMVAVSIIFLLPLLLFFILWVRRTWRQRHLDNYEEVDELMDTRVATAPSQ